MENKQATINLSALERTQHKEALSTEQFDLVVIGGGITGCGIALDAASRGMKVALLEREDFAAGTSSKSTKLIHGGLRYLKQLEFGLVRETGTERAIVHRLAPHLVLPEKMLLPIVKGGTYGKLAASFGVMVYDVLAGVSGDDRRKMLSKAETLQKEPLLDEAVLKGSCFYAEYRTDDARLTIELLKRAASYGAIAINHCSAKDFIYEQERITGVVCEDHLDTTSFSIKARQVVSAGGPWVDILRKQDQSLKGKRLHLTKGVHIVFPHAKLPIQHSTYFDVPDGRMVFAIPRGKITYVGTTDTTYTGDLNRVLATKGDVQYLLDAVQHAFPSIQLTKRDVESSWSGLRPLIHEDGKSPSELSRKDEIFESPSGLLSIAGGKLTGYRKMAQRIVDRVDQQLEGKFGACKTKTIALTASPLKNTKEVEQYMHALEKRLTQLGLTPYYAFYLTTTYGKDAEKIVEKMADFDNIAELALCRAEAWYGVHFEMVQSLADFFVRRTGRLYFDIKSIQDTRSQVASDLAAYLYWDKARQKMELQQLAQLVEDATHF